MPTSIVDTNVLVYWIDREDEERHEIADRFIASITRSPADYVVAEQNLREFAAVATHRTAMDEAEFTESFRTIQAVFLETLAETPEDYLEAFRLVKRHKAPYWDALLVATMRRHGIHAIITENEKDFKKFPGIRVINPFKGGRLEE